MKFKHLLLSACLALSSAVTLAQEISFGIIATDSASAQREKWEPFFKEMQDTLYSLYEDKQMVTATDFAEAWREVAAGLKSVK